MSRLWPFTAHRLFAKALALLAACAPCAAAAHTAGAAAAVDVVECVAYARMHPAIAERGDIGTDAAQGDAAEGTLPEFRIASAPWQPEVPASDCWAESDARPRMNPARSAQPPGDLALRITWRQRDVPDRGAAGPAGHGQWPDCAAARDVPRAPFAHAAQTPLARFEHAPRGPPAPAVASHS